MRRWVRQIALLAGGGLTVIGLQFITVTSLEAQRKTKMTTPHSCLLEPGPRVRVVGIENSETLRLADGRKVRLLGTLGPRPPLTAPKRATPASPTWRAEQDAQEALKTLVGGREVTLAFDNRRQDRYGRWIGHVFVWHDGRRFWVQGEMLAHGHARAYVLPGTTACAAELVAHEALARDSRRGLWRDRYYRILKPRPAGWLLRERRHQFEIVSGKVAKVAVVKSKIYLNFGRNWRNDFTAALPKRALLGTKHSLADVIGLKGRRVRVRGWIERNNGPYIKLAHPDLIEILDPPTPVLKDQQHDSPALAGAAPDIELQGLRKRQLSLPRIKRRTKKRPKPEVSKPEISDALKL